MGEDPGIGTSGPACQVLLYPEMTPILLLWAYQSEAFEPFLESSTLVPVPKTV